MYYVFVEHGFKSTTLSTSANSSGFHSERSDPSPPSHHLSGSAPAEFVVGSFHKDDGIDIEDFEDETIDVDTVEPKRKRQVLKERERDLTPQQITIPVSTIRSTVELLYIN